MDTEELLDEAIVNGFAKLGETKAGSTEQEKATENVAKLYKLRLEEKKIELDHREKMDRMEMEDKQHGDELEIKEHDMAAADRKEKHEKLQNWAQVGIDVVGKVVLPAGAFILGMLFEETGTITSFFNKQAMGNLFRRR